MHITGFHTRSKRITHTTRGAIPGQIAAILLVSGVFLAREADAATPKKFCIQVRPAKSLEQRNQASQVFAQSQVQGGKTIRATVNGTNVDITTAASDNAGTVAEKLRKAIKDAGIANVAVDAAPFISITSPSFGTTAKTVAVAELQDEPELEVITVEGPCFVNDWKATVNELRLGDTFEGGGPLSKTFTFKESEQLSADGKKLEVKLTITNKSANKLEIAVLVMLNWMGTDGTLKQTPGVFTPGVLDILNDRTKWADMTDFDIKSVMVNKAGDAGDSAMLTWTWPEGTATVADKSFAMSRKFLVYLDWIWTNDATKFGARRVVTDWITRDGTGAITDGAAASSWVKDPPEIPAGEERCLSFYPTNPFFEDERRPLRLAPGPDPLPSTWEITDMAPDTSIFFELDPHEMREGTVCVRAPSVCTSQDSVALLRIDVYDELNGNFFMRDFTELRCVDCGDGTCQLGEDPCVCEEDCPGTCLEAIPTVSAWGLVVMALLLIGGAKIYFARRETGAA